MSRHPVAVTLAAAALSLGAGFAAGSLPPNSVGSPQLKNAQVASVDLQDSGVAGVDVKDASLARVDFAAGSLTTQPTTATTRNGLSCAPGGWCYVTVSGSGTTVGSFSAEPANATGWNSTAPIDLGRPSSVLFSVTASATFAGAGGDVTCAVKDGTTSLVTSGFVRSSGNTGRILRIKGVVSMAAGSHVVTLNCRAVAADTVAISSVRMSALIVPQS